VTEKLELTGEQKNALNLDKNLLVLAGAGSGKTRVLTERYLKIVEHSIARGRPVKPGNILVVTFTEKAAGEMRERIQKRVENQRGEDWENFSDHFLDNQISTFHSFCARLLKTFPLESGVDPEFRVIEGFDQQQLLMETVEKEINQLSRVQDRGLEKLLSLWNRRQLEKNLIELVDKRYEIKNILEEYENSNPDELLDRWFGKKEFPYLSYKEIIELLQPLIGYSELNVQESDKGISFIRDLADFYFYLQNKGLPPDIWEEAIDFHELVKKFISSGDYLTMKSHHQVGIKGNWKGLEKEHQEMKKLLLEIRENLERILPPEDINLLPTRFDREAARLFPHLAQIVRGCIDRFQKAKKQQNFLDFNDLEGFTHSLIVNNKTVSQKLGDRFRYIMVDEFQDTNSRQWEIIERIWRGGKKSNLFLVGDIKQAIYSFRGGDVTIFHRGKREILNSGEEIIFNKNFRSCGSLIKFFNSFFKELFKGASAEYEAPFQELEPGEEKKDFPGEVMALVINEKGDRLSRISAEARTVAEKVSDLLPLLEEDQKKPRLAILLRSLTHVHHYEKALRKKKTGFTTVRGKGFFNQQEIFDLCNLLFFLANPRKDIELVGLLRSPLIGVSDPEIFELAQIEGNSFWEKIQKAEDKLWINIKKDLSRWFFLKDRLPLGEFLQAIIMDSRLFLNLSLGERSQQKIRNVEKFLEIARRFSRGGRSLGEFNHFLEQQLKTPTEEGEAVTDVDTDVVIMSIHQAKGLQFPAVILADLAGQFNWGHGDPIRKGKIGEKEELGFGVIDPETGLRGTPAVRKRIGERLKVEQLAEEKRLFYVAVTRAERYLLLVGSRENNREIDDFSQAKSFLDWLEVAYGGPGFPLAREEGVLKVEEVEETEKDLSPLPGVEKNPVSFLEGISEEELVGWKPKPLPGHLEIELSPTDLSLYLTCPLRYYYRQELLVDERMLLPRKDFGSGEKKRVEPVKVGKILHGLMEQKTYQATGQIWEDQLKNLEISQELQKDYQKELRKHLDNLQASGWLDRINRAEEDIREKKFRVKWKKKDNLVINLKGIVDRLIREKDGWKLIDFKTTHIGDKDIEEITCKNNYHIQLACYIEALGCLQPGVEIEQAWLIYTSAGQAMEIKTSEATKKIIEDVARQIAARNFPLRTAEHCNYCEFYSICPAY